MLEEEEVIANLEEADSTFSSINRSLKEIRSKILTIGRKNQRILEDLEPWMNFFSSDQVNLEEVGLDKKIQDKVYDRHNETTLINGSPLVMKFSSPKNPFMENTSSEFANKTFLERLENKFKTSSLVETSSPASIQLNNNYDTVLYAEESDLDELREFDLLHLPEAFRQEPGIQEVYNFVRVNEHVTVERVKENFLGTMDEKIDLFVDVLVRKLMIRNINGILTAKSKKDDN